MGKLITKEDGYEIRLGQKNPTCYPCCFEGSVCACRSDLCIKHRETISESMGNSRREKVFISDKRSHERRGHFPIW